MKRDPLALQEREHDVLVIGGGIAGAWVVWEAASRGLRAALIEGEDFGQATSWASLKTAHGGLRHLQRLDIAGFRESVRERRSLLRVAPEIVRPLAFAIAATGGIDRAKFTLGGLANDVLSSDRNAGLRFDRTIGPSRVLSGSEATSLGVKALAGGAVFLWQDAQITHTERLLMGVLHAASKAQALVVNRCRLVSSISRAGGFEVKVQDLFEGREGTLRTRAIVNASGAKLEAVAGLMGETCASPPLIRGVNVVLGRDPETEIAIGARDRGRFLFLVPWLGRTILGTMYDDGQRPEEELVRDLLEAGRRAFPWASLTADAIQVVHAGHVPRGTDKEPLYRSRLLRHQDPRLVSILTAKYTTARATAEAAIDHLGRTLSIPLARSVSAHTALAMAKPLTGSLEERIRLAEETEMALSPADALRGRLPEGGFGSTLAAPPAGA